MIQEINRGVCSFRLTGETAKRFNRLAKSPDMEAQRKRDAFLNEGKKEVDVKFESRKKE